MTLYSLSDPLVLSFCSGILAVAVAVAMFWFRKDHFPVAGLTAVVTGGSQGLGLAIAEELAAKGAHVAIVAQDKGKLEQAERAIQKRAVTPQTQKVLNLSFDLRDPASAAEIMRQVTAWNGGQPPDLIFCSAGNCQPAFFADASIDTLRGQMDTVYWSAAYMAHAALNVWKQPTVTAAKSTPPKPTRHLVLVSSVLAFFPVAGYSPYTPAKAAMKALADGLSQEVAVYNGARQGSASPAPAADIAVHVMYPMGILSPGFVNENKIKPALTVKLEEGDSPQEPADLAKILLRRLSAGDFTITTAFLGHLMGGWGMAGSVRTSVWDYVWNWLGSLALIVISPVMISQCKSWGKRKGVLATGPAQ